MLLLQKAPKSSKVGGEIVLEVPGRDIDWLKGTRYAFVESCELEWKRLNGEVDEEEGSDDDEPDIDSLELVLRRDAGCAQDIGPVDPGVGIAWGNLKTEMKRAQNPVLTTVETVLELSPETLPSRDEIRRRLTAAAGKVVRGVDEHEKLKAVFCDDKVKLELMENSKEMITHADEKAAAAHSQTAEVKGELGKVAEKCNEFKGKLRMVKAESSRRLIRLNTLFVKQARM